MPAGASNSRLRVLLTDAIDVPRACFFHRVWTRLEVFGPGPGVSGLFRWAPLLCDGVSQGGAAATAQDELEDPRDLCHVFSRRWFAC